MEGFLLTNEEIRFHFDFICKHNPMLSLEGTMKLIVESAIIAQEAKTVSLLKEAGYVRLSEDQNFPKYPLRRWDVAEVREDMFKAGFRKVILGE